MITSTDQSSGLTKDRGQSARCSGDRPGTLTIQRAHPDSNEDPRRGRHDEGVEMSGRLSDLTGAERRRAVSLAIVKVFAVWFALFGAYYLAPVSLLEVLRPGGSGWRLGPVRGRRGLAGTPDWPGEASAVEAVQALGLLIQFFLVLLASFYLSLAAVSPELLPAARSHGLAVLHGHRLRHNRVRRYRPVDRACAAGRRGPDAARPGGARRRRSDRALRRTPPDRGVAARVGVLTNLSRRSDLPKLKSPAPRGHCPPCCG